jgi:hypothetical protein
MLRKPKALLLATAAIAAAAVSATTAEGAATGPERAATDKSVSSNWSGYVVNGPDPTATTSFSRVSARWVAPKAACTPGRNTYSAFWVGLGGSLESSEALEQIGTEADCRATGTAVYSMWYELVPAASVRIKYKVFPGNAITATVTVVGTQVTLQIRNLTRRTKFTKVSSPPALDLSSAEWVAEAPSSCDSSGNCVVLPLTNFGSVSFASAAATGDGHTGTISDPAWTATQVDLVTDSSLPVGGQTLPSGAAPSALSSDGGAFSIDWLAAVPEAGSAPALRATHR